MNMQNRASTWKDGVTGSGRQLALRHLIATGTVLFLLGVFCSGVVRAQAPVQRLDVPYVPTPQPVVDAMLEMAGVKQGDLVYDLGSGDGRIVITAAKKYGTRGIGIDLNPDRVQEAVANAKEAGVERLVEFRAGDLFKTDLSDASVVTLYLLTSVNHKLRPQLWEQLKVGTRVVSHAFDMGEEWPPEREEMISGSRVYMWTIKEEHKRRLAQRQ